MFYPQNFRLLRIEFYVYKTIKKYLSLELHEYFSYQRGTKMVDGTKRTNTMLNAQKTFAENLLYLVDIHNFIITV
jgi:hypothetical protein